MAGHNSLVCIKYIESISSNALTRTWPWLTNALFMMLPIDFFCAVIYQAV